MDKNYSSSIGEKIRDGLYNIIPWRALLSVVAMLMIVSALERLPVVHRTLENAPHWHENPHAYAWFMVFAVPYCAFGLPRQALCIAAGMAFGLWSGLSLCSLAYVLGALCAYGWARVCAPKRFRKKILDRLNKSYSWLARILHQKPFRAVLTLRLMPIGSALLVSTAAGLFELPILSFGVATFLGGIPQNLVFSLIGSGVRIGHIAQLGLAGSLFIISGILGAVLLRRAEA
ncbi:TVP38/TMEM64 family protein [Swingsia samuiensis]|uniref:TVP38/TMEM64 family membrane protein n=1 Tax=Swingsia samuiensis TaxID=1293412 RepID=A0A4Y6UIZ1_9PROT|nr:VTT domain-containing protein [Swingsia samuiensis]QDH17034.1 DedA family protein [Swingsia samuiensis]